MKHIAALLATLAILWIGGAVLFWLLRTTSAFVGRNADPELWIAGYFVFASGMTLFVLVSWFRRR